MDAAAGQRVIFASYFSKQNLFKTIYILVVPLLPTTKSSVDTSSGGLALREVPFFSFFLFYRRERPTLPPGLCSVYPAGINVLLRKAMIFN